MRHAQGGGVDAAGRARREALRMQAAARLAGRIAVPEVARRLRVSVRSVYRWKAAVERGGTAALQSRGPLAVPPWRAERLHRGDRPVIPPATTVTSIQRRQ
jgi:hypothetical protein